MPEELNHITPLPFWLKPFKEEDKPYYTECEKRIIAWSLAFEGTASINKDRTSYHPTILIANTDFELIEKFFKTIGKLGILCEEKPDYCKAWIVKNYYQVSFLLEQLKGYMTCKKYRKLRSLVAEFCQSRIHKHENKLDLNYDKRELEIVRQVRKLNEKGKSRKK